MLWWQFHCKSLLIWINCDSQKVIFYLRLIQMCMGQRTALNSMENSWFILLLVTEARQNHLFGPKSVASIVLRAKDHKKRWKSIVIPTCYLTALSHYLRSDEVANSQPSEDCIGLSPLPWGFLQKRICKCSSLKIINFWWLGLVSAIVRGGVSLECWESLGTWLAIKIKYSLIWKYNLQPHAW